MMVVTTILDYRIPELGYFFWNYILRVYVLRFNFLDHDDGDHGLRLFTGIPSLGYFVWTHIFPVYLRFTFLVVMIVSTFLDFRNPK